MSRFLGYWIYRLLLCILSPAVFVARILKDKTFNPKLLMHRFAFALPKVAATDFWFHAASIGEVQQAFFLAQQLLQAGNKKHIILSVTSQIAFQNACTHVRALNPKGVFVAVFFLPLDFGWVIKRVHRHFGYPHLVVFETEIWPSLFLQVQRFAKVTMVNAQIRERSLPRYQKFLPFLPTFLPKVQVFCKSKVDKQRFLSLGVQEVEVLGNLKLAFFAQNLKTDVEPIFCTRKMIVWGSFRLQEKEALVQCLQTLQSFDEPSCESYFFVCIPRHLGEAKFLQSFLKQNHIPSLLFSEHPQEFFAELSSPQSQLQSSRPAERVTKPKVMIFDDFGRLLSFYASSHCAVIGGTFATNIGGHNPLEPLFFRKASFVGQDTAKINDLLEVLAPFKVIKSVFDGKQLAYALQEALKDQDVDLQDTNKRLDKAFEFCQSQQKKTKPLDSFAISTKQIL